LKPMILNATNSKMLKTLTDSPFIDDWQNVAVTVFVDSNVKFGRETMEGLRIRAGVAPQKQPISEQRFNEAIAAIKADSSKRESVVLRLSKYALNAQQEQELASC